MRRFGSESFKSMLAMLVTEKGNDTETPLESKMFSRFVESAQKKIEGNNFDTRKNVVEYDEVLRKQRDIIYGQRASILFLDDITDIIVKMMTNTGYRIANTTVSEDQRGMIDATRFLKEIDGVYFPLGFVTKDEVEGLSIDDAIDLFVNKYDLDIYPEYEIIKCNVTFGYTDPTTNEYVTLSTQVVDYFDSAILPTDKVEITGYKNNGWDKDYTSIKGDTIINLVLEPIYFTVTFINGEDDSVIDVQKVRYGEDAEYPTPPEVKGMHFESWRG